MTKARAITVALVLATVALWLAWDVYVVLAYGREATESFVIFRWTRDWPQLIFVFGYLMGHWTWGQPIKPKPPQTDL